MVVSKNICLSKFSYCNNAALISAAYILNPSLAVIAQNNFILYLYFNYVVPTTNFFLYVEYELGRGT